MLTGDSVGIFIFEAQLINFDQLITADKSHVFVHDLYCEQLKIAHC